MRLSYKSCMVAAIVAVAFVLSVGAATAQSGGSSGTINGTVLDPSGAVVPNASVEIHNAVSGYDRTVTTDSKGSFTFANVPFNPYHMKVMAAGFASYAQDVESRSVAARDRERQLGGRYRHGHSDGRVCGRLSGKRSHVPY